MGYGDQRASRRDCERRLIGRMRRYGRAHLEVAEVRRWHRRAKSNKTFKQFATAWTRRTGRQAVPELLVAAIRDGDSRAEDMLAAPTNEMLRDSRCGIDADTSRFTDLPQAIAWVTEQFGPTVVAMWAANLAWRWPETLYGTLPALLAHPDYGELTAELADLDERVDDPCAVAVATARDVLVELRDTGAAPDPWGLLTVGGWYDVTNQLGLLTELDADDLDGADLQDDLAAALADLIARGAGEMDDSPGDDVAGPHHDPRRDRAYPPADAPETDAVDTVAADPPVPTDEPSDAAEAGLGTAPDRLDAGPLAGLFPDVATLDDAELAAHLGAAAATLRDAAVRAVDAVKAGAAPPHDAVVALVAGRVLADEAAERAGLPDGPVDQLVAALQPAPVDPTLLALSQVTATAETAEPAAAALRAAASDALAGGDTDVALLHDVAEALTPGQPIDHARISQLASRLGGDPHGIALAAADCPGRRPAPVPAEPMCPSTRLVLGRRACPYVSRRLRQPSTMGR